MQQATLKDIEADTVLADLRTDKNKLSVWKIESDEDLNDAFIALGSKCAYTGTIDAVMIDAEKINCLAFDNEEGNTPTIGINTKHKNIIDLNYVSLGDVAASVLHGLKNNGYIRRTKGQMKSLLAEAYKNSRLVTEDLDPHLKDEILVCISQQKENNG